MVELRPLDATAFAHRQALQVTEPVKRHLDVVIQTAVEAMRLKGVPTNLYVVEFGHDVAARLAGGSAEWVRTVGGGL
jgi:hypothetical protein